MSYCRFGWDGSDVYVIGTRVSGEDGFECIGCLLMERRWYFVTSEREMIAHLLTHRADGDNVPQSAIDRLQAESEGKEYRDDEDVFDVMRRNPHMFMKTQAEMDAIIDEAKRLSEKEN